MYNYVRALLLSTIVLLMLAGLAQVQGADPGDNNLVVISDPGLEENIRFTVGKQQGDITREDMEKITVLYAQHSGISDLRGLEYAVNLQELIVFGNQVSDLSPLAGLDRLEKLLIRNNQISDLGPLENLTSLKELNLENNEITRVEPLAPLTGLRALSLGNNQVSDLGPLSSFAKLHTLGLNRNQVSDLAPLENLTSLEELHLWDNQASDLGPLGSLINLEILDVSSNQVSDLTPLSNLVNLQSLSFGENSVEELGPVAGLSKLSNLSFYDSQVKDLGPLAGLTNLERLNFSLNQVSDLDPLAGLTRLDTLSFANNRVSDLTPLAGLTNLHGVYLGGNQVRDIAVLENLTSLRFLFFEENLVSNIGPLVKLEDLQMVNMRLNYLDLGEESGALEVIQELKGSNVNVQYVPQRILSLEGLELGVATDPSKAVIPEIKEGTLTFIVNREDTYDTAYGVLIQDALVSIQNHDGSRQRKDILFEKGPVDGKKALEFLKIAAGAATGNDLIAESPLMVQLECKACGEVETYTLEFFPGDCFIATAAFGSRLDPAVNILRQSRDNILLQSLPGQKIVDYYYHISPPVAEYISSRHTLKGLVRVALLPVVLLSYLALKQQALLCLLGLVAAIAVVGAYFFRRRVSA